MLRIMRKANGPSPKIKVATSTTHKIGVTNTESIQILPSRNGRISIVFNNQIGNILIIGTDDSQVSQTQGIIVPNNSQLLLTANDIGSTIDFAWYAMFAGGAVGDIIVVEIYNQP